LPGFFANMPFYNKIMGLSYAGFIIYMPFLFVISFLFPANCDGMIICFPTMEAYILSIIFGSLVYSYIFCKIKIKLTDRKKL
jgi:hypothetical protein